MKKFYTFFSKQIFSVSAFFVSGILFSQPVLLPGIGLSSLPADNTPICNIVCSTGYDPDSEGIAVGAVIPQFQFYTVNGIPYDAQSLLNTGKPLCIVAGSYTCPVWRNRISDLNNLIATYGSQVNFLVVYVVEAHPVTPDVSPYSCTVWTTSENQNCGVLYLQPTDYGQRKAAAQDMLNNLHGCTAAINAPVVIDGPCNEFWTTFGEAPNNAYLINPLDGTVFCKHGWFNQAPNDMGACISSLLSTLGVEEQNALKLVSVFPNPSASTITFKNEKEKIKKVEITDVLGNSVLVSVLSATPEAVMDISELPAGMYSYKITGEGENVFFGKIIKQ